MSAAHPTVRERIRLAENTLTSADRKIVAVMLEAYPLSGLGRITDLADTSGVSTPTVARFVQKIGFEGFAAFQKALRGEAQARDSGPLDRRSRWATDVPQTHLLNRFTDRVIDNIRMSLAALDPQRFDAAADLLAQEDRHVYIVGGRITRSLAEYLFSHLLLIRPRVVHMTASSATWPHYLVDIAQGDTVVIFDIRRYESNLLQVAQEARRKGAEVLLLTDQWRSPVEREATHTISVHVETPSPWDSNVALLLMAECLISGVQDRVSSDDRMAELEQIFNRSGRFRR